MSQDAEPASDILITALIVTYNHAAYIGTVIESALAQVTSFPLEILICDDASSDGTADIVRHYATRFPHRIRTILAGRNLGANGNVARGLRAARGRFLAMLDGDDLWTSPDKLERQARYLLEHPQCTGHFFNARIMRGEEATAELWTPPGQPARATLADIWQGNPYPTAGGMLRLDRIGDVPDWYERMSPITDWPLYLLAAAQGELHFDPAPAAFYRLHDGGAFSALSNLQKLRRTDRFYQEMNRNLAGRFSGLARAGRSRLFHDWAESYLHQGKLRLAGEAWRMSLTSGLGPGAVSLRKTLRLGWRIAGRSLGR
jgi:glycosyltransferase involved in cell wall biosynthesis